MSGPVVEAVDVTRILPGVVPVTLVRDVSLNIAAGEFVAITGPSGSGKSSLLYLLGLLDIPTEGRVLVEDRETADMDPSMLADLRLRKLGFVFQFHFLLPEFTALGNVMIPMRRLGAWPMAEMRRRALGILGDLGLEDCSQKRPNQLSGGERQRVAVARALANDPRIILADEPTGNLDSQNSEIVFEIFARLAEDEGRTVIVVTHERDMAARTHRRLQLVDGRLVD